MLVLHVVLHVCCMCVACVLHVRCMGRAMQITYLNWGNRKSVAGTRVLGGRRETLEAENLGAAVMRIQPKPRELLRPCLAQSGMQESGLGNARSNEM